MSAQPDPAQRTRRLGGSRRQPMRFVAECETCGLVIDTGKRANDRMTARRHAEREGHLVVAITERTTYYDGRLA